jgi:hypothetical protein
MRSLNATVPKIRQYVRWSESTGALEPRQSPRAHPGWILRHGSMPCDPGL